jgi:hypothetical protein
MGNLFQGRASAFLNRALSWQSLSFAFATPISSSHLTLNYTDPRITEKRA